MKKIARIHITIIFCLLFLGVISKIYRIDSLNILKVLVVPYIFIGNFIYWILLKKSNKNHEIITKATPGCENRLYYISSITNFILGYGIIKGLFKVNIRVEIYSIIVFVIIIASNYKNREKEGPFLTYYKKGKIIEDLYEVTGKKGVLSDEVFTERKGSESYKLYFENGSKKLDGPCKTYYKNGNLFIKYSYVNGVIEGEAKQYYENKQLKKEGYYKNGKLEGPYKEYYEDGELYKEAIFKNGVIEGEAKTYYENGQIQSGLFFKNDELDGESRTYYDNGQLEEVYFSKNGIEDGLYKEYYKNGQLKMEGKLENGELEGSWKEYLESGELEKKIFYKKGKIIEGEEK